MSDGTVMYICELWWGSVDVVRSVPDGWDSDTSLWACGTCPPVLALPHRGAATTGGGVGVGASGPAADPGGPRKEVMDALVGQHGMRRRLSLG